MRTIIQFEIIKIGENNFVIDPTAIYIRGWVNQNMLNELLTSENYLNDLGEGMEVGKAKTMTLEVWEDSDDGRSWLDYRVLPDEFEVGAHTDEKISEIIEWMETLLSAESKLGASDEVIRAYLSVQQKLTSVFGEQKK